MALHANGQTRNINTENSAPNLGWIRSLLAHLYYYNAEKVDIITNIKEFLIEIQRPVIKPNMFYIR